MTQREVLDIARIRHAELLPRMFRLLAALTAQELNITALSRDLGLDDDTVRSYLPLLETVFLLHRLPAWSRNLTARVKRRPKVHLTTVRAEDFRHLVALRERIGSALVAGIVLFAGERPLPFGDRMLALPISLLWNGAPPPETG